MNEWTSDLQDRFSWSQTGLVLRPTVSDHITAKGAMPPPQDAKHCATWHLNNTMLVCTAIKNAITGIKLCLSISPGLKFQIVYFKNAPASGGLRPQIPFRGFIVGHINRYFYLLIYLLTPQGTSVPRPLICSPTPPSRSAPDVTL